MQERCKSVVVALRIMQKFVWNINPSIKTVLLVQNIPEYTPVVEHSLANFSDSGLTSVTRIAWQKASPATTVDRAFSTTDNSCVCVHNYKHEWQDSSSFKTILYVSQVTEQCVGVIHSVVRNRQHLSSFLRVEFIEAETFDAQTDDEATESASIGQSSDESTDSESDQEVTATETPDPARRLSSALPQQNSHESAPPTSLHPSTSDQSGEQGLIGLQTAREFISGALHRKHLKRTKSQQDLIARCKA